MPKGGSERIVRSGANARRTIACLDGATDLDPLSVVERALELAELHVVPEDDAAFEAFASGALFIAICERAGEARARELVAALLRRETQTAASAPAPRETVVLLVTGDAERARRIRARLAGRVAVREASDLAGLLAHVEASLDARILLVVDEAVPGLEGTILTTLTRLLPPSASLLFRGDAPSGLYHVAVAWATLPEDASPEEVADRCLSGVGSQERPKRKLAERPMVVLVEPDEVVRSLMARCFEHEGYVVVPREDGLGGLEACIDHEPDVLVAPCAMDDLDGAALARLVRGRLGSAAPAIVLRGDPPADKAPAVRVIPTDARFADLLAEVRRLAPSRRL